MITNINIMFFRHVSNNGAWIVVFGQGQTKGPLIKNGPGFRLRG